MEKRYDVIITVAMVGESNDSNIRDARTHRTHAQSTKYAIVP